MLPTTRDMHIHLDKTFYGGPWRSLNRPAGTTIQDMIKLEQKMLPELQPYTQERAEKLIDLLQSKGTTIARSHCNIEPVSGLKNLQICRRCWRDVRRALSVKSSPSRSTVCCCRNLNL